MLSWKNELQIRKMKKDYYLPTIEFIKNMVGLVHEIGERELDSAEVRKMFELSLGRYANTLFEAMDRSGVELTSIEYKKVFNISAQLWKEAQPETYEEVVGLSNSLIAQAMAAANEGKNPVGLGEMKHGG